MFRRMPQSLPKDAEAPADMKSLGYFVTEQDQIRQIHDPSQKYIYRIDRNDRVNDLHKESMNKCTRQLVRERLFEAGLEELRLPIGVSTNDKYVPILVSKDIATKQRVIVLFPDRTNDLGIFAYRVLGEEGINVGSAVNFTKGVLGDNGIAMKTDTPGLIIANAAQLTWFHGQCRAVTDREWQSLPRASAVHEAFRIDEERNRIPGNKNHIQHVQYIFEHVMTRVCHKEAKFNLIGLEYTGTAAMHYLADHWHRWITRVTSVALITPQHSLQELLGDNLDGQVKIRDFVAKRMRAYFVSDAPLGSPVEGEDRHGCKCFSSGEALYDESAIIRCWKSILAWFDEVHESPNFAMPVVKVTTYHMKQENI